MSKIGKILNKKVGYSVTPKQWDDIVLAMQEYAEWYAKQCLILADEEINTHENITRPIDLEKLPPHD